MRASPSEASEDGDHRHEPADEPEPDDELAGRERAERVAGVAAAVEVGHAARALASARVRGELGAFGMEGRDARARPRRRAETSG